MLYENAPVVLDALEIVEAHSALGKRLVTWSRGKNIPIDQNHTSMPEEGTCHYDLNGKMSIIVADRNDCALNTHVIPHELMHAVQFSTTFRLHNRLNRTVNGKDRARMSLALEAGAETLAIRVSHDIRQSTMKDKFWQPLPLYEPLFETFDRTYQAELKRGISHNSAIQAACDVTYQQYFETQPLIDIYNTQSLDRYIKSVLSLLPATATEELPNTFAVDTTDLRTSISHKREPFITAPTLPVSENEVFGYNDDMRQAFAYVDFYRVRKLYGSHVSPKVKDAVGCLMKDFNQFIGIDLYEVVKECERKRDKGSDQQEIPNTLQAMRNVAAASRAYNPLATTQPRVFL